MIILSGFVALWNCGCVFSERALKELKTNICSICQTPYTEQDVVILNGNEKDVDLMKTKIDSRVARLKADKREKKKQIKAAETTVKIEPSTPCSASNSNEEDLAAAPSTSSLKSKLKIFKPSITAAKREIDLGPLSSDPNAKKVKKDYSVANDEKATEVYKSLFTSHESEQTQQRAHWITFNPHYY